MGRRKEENLSRGDSAAEQETAISRRFAGAQTVAAATPSADLVRVPPVPTSTEDVKELSRDDLLLLAGRLAGRADAHAANENLNRVTRIAVYRQIKETETYRVVGSWEEYCASVLGRPRSSVDEEIAWFDSLGPELLTTALQAGMGRSALRLLHAGQKDEDTRLVLQGGEIIVGSQRAPLEDEKAANDLLAQHISWLQNQMEDAHAAAAEKDTEIKAQAEEIGGLKEKLQEKREVEKQRRRYEELEAAATTDIARGILMAASVLAELGARAETERPERAEILRAARVLPQHVTRLIDFGAGRHKYEVTAPEIDLEALDDVMRAQTASEAALAREEEDDA